MTSNNHNNDQLYCDNVFDGLESLSETTSFVEPQSKFNANLLAPTPMPLVGGQPSPLRLSASAGIEVKQESPALFAAPLQELHVIEQEFVTRCNEHRNGVNHDVWVWVKNSPRCLTLKLMCPLANGDAPVDISRLVRAQQIALSAELVYDTHQHTPVHVLPSTQPVQADFLLQNDDEFKISARINELSSKHHEQNFCIKITAKHAATNQPLPNLTVYSYPIKVVSKKAQAHHQEKRSPPQMPLPDSLVRTGRKSNRKRRHQSTAATDDEATRGADSDSDEEFSAAASPTKRVAKQRAGSRRNRRKMATIVNSGVRVKQEPQDDVTLDTNKAPVQPQQPAPFAFEQPMKRARVLESPDAAAFTVCFSLPLPRHRCCL